MATGFANFGSAVTVLARDGLLPLAEPFVGERVRKSLEEAGVSVHLGAEAVSVNRGGDGTVHVTLTDGEQVEADELLVAIGRTPNTQDIGLDKIGLRVGGWLTVDDTLRVVDQDGSLVGDGWLYAAGDVNHRVLLTHQGKYQARAVGDVIVARATGEVVDDRPWGGRRHRRRAGRPAGDLHRPGGRVGGADRGRRLRPPGCGSGSSTTTWPPSPEPPCTPTATKGTPGWSSMRTGR